MTVSPPSRRQFLKITGGTVGAIGVLGASSGVTGATQTDSATGSAWSQFRTSTANSGHTPLAGPKHDFTREWRSESRSITRQPTISNDIVFVPVSYHEQQYGKGRFRALDAESGEELWSKDTDEANTPAVGDGSVYWSDTRHLYALNQIDGSVQWQFGTDDSDEYPIVGTPVLGNETLYVLRGHELLAVSPDDGSIQWRFELTNRTRESDLPAVSDGRVAVLDGSERDTDTIVRVIDAENGSELWNVSVPDAGRTDSRRRPGYPVMSDGMVFVAGATLYAFDAASGERRWTVTNEEEDEEFSPPAVCNGHAFIYHSRETDDGQRETRILALDSESGDTLWTVQSDGRNPKPPTVADGVVYLSWGDHIATRSASTGELLERREFDGFETGGIWTSIAVTEGRLYYGTYAPEDTRQAIVALSGATELSNSSTETPESTETPTETSTSTQTSTETPTSTEDDTATPTVGEQATETPTMATDHASGDASSSSELPVVIQNILRLLRSF